MQLLGNVFPVSCVLTISELLGARKSVFPGSLLAHPIQPPANRFQVRKTPSEMKNDLHSQLSAVEKLQYQLTSHELEFAQRMAQQEQLAAEKVKVTVVSSSSDSSESESWFITIGRVFCYFGILLLFTEYFCMVGLLEISNGYPSLRSRNTIVLWL